MKARDAWFDLVELAVRTGRWKIVVDPRSFPPSSWKGTTFYDARAIVLRLKKHKTQEDLEVTLWHEMIHAAFRLVETSSEEDKKEEYRITTVLEKEYRKLSESRKEIVRRMLKQAKRKPYHG